MEIIDPEQKKYVEERNRPVHVAHSENSGRIIAGIIIIGIGFILLARKLGFYLPDWLTSWPMLVVAIGFLVGAKNSFMPGGWMIAVLVGGLFLIDNWFLDFSIRPFILPAVLIIVGAFMMLSPGKRTRFRRSNRSSGLTEGVTSSEELMEAVSVFGGTKRNIISKNFKGGEVTCIFGGSEINLSQADIQGTAFLEVNQLFGGTKLIVPSNWQVKVESTAILGSVEDTRIGNKENVDQNKTLVLEGTSVFGGINIKSY